jgi:phenylacetic acid degradation operon negative regulatory protein
MFLVLRFSDGSQCNASSCAGAVRLGAGRWGTAVAVTGPASGGAVVRPVESARNAPGPSGTQPRALIVTVYGLYARQSGGWMSAASLVELLARCGVDEPSVRSAIFRLKRRGLLLAAKRGGVAGYALSDAARVILDEGDRRIFERRRATMADGWLLAVFSVPESHRHHRHQLRSQLTRLGFGTVAAGVWIAPAHVLEEARAVLTRHGLEHYVELFGDSHVAFADPADLVARCWDLDRLDEQYRAFLDRQVPVLAGYRGRRRIDPGQAFTDYVGALTQWRRLPFLDPGLPEAVLPAGWNGIRAADTFFELRDRLTGPAAEYVAARRSPVGSS